MPVGTGSFLFGRVYVGDVAQAVLAALAVLGNESGVGQVFNIVEARTAPMRLFYEQIVAAAGAELELVRVRDDLLPADLRAVGAVEQHLLASAQKARDVLGWRDSDGTTVLRRSVRWHLEHPPPEWDSDFSADDAALGAA
jgi:nucleoside-diphosphate-sugar epimerase